MSRTGYRGHQIHAIIGVFWHVKHVNLLKNSQEIKLLEWSFV